MKRQSLLFMFFAVAVLLFCYCELSHAVTIDVGNGGTYSTIQSGYDAAGNGDTIKVYESTYGENDNFNRNVSVALTGGYDNSFSTDCSCSAITGTLTISNGTVTAENIIIQATQSSSGNGTCGYSGGQPTVTLNSPSTGASQLSGYACNI